jgi:outer membrane immunogenic protein
VDPFTEICVLCTEQRQGGRGAFGTVGGGFDWQFNPSWVVGAFADAQFGDIKGTIQDQGPYFVGDLKLKTSWAAGVRLGYLVAPNVLTYVNGGYSGSDWSSTTMVSAWNGAPSTYGTPSFRRDGWFIGGGIENSLPFFGGGWFVKTEYRLAQYERIVLPDVSATIPVPNDSITFKPTVQTISAQLVYRFNWLR